MPLKLKLNVKQDIKIKDSMFINIYVTHSCIVGKRIQIIYEARELK